VPLEGLIDVAKEKARLEKELSKVESELKKIALKTENHEFLARAPEAEKAVARAAHQAVSDKKQSLLRTIAELS
jgi:valyl-tRNA synthetase